MQHPSDTVYISNAFQFGVSDLRYASLLGQGKDCDQCCLRKDTAETEWVQREVMYMIRGMESLSYEERLKTVGLYSLQKRWLKWDGIELYKVMNGTEKLNWVLLFTLSHDSGKWRHSRKSKGNLLKNNTINLWNSVPQDITKAKSLVGVKKD